MRSPPRRAAPRSAPRHVRGTKAPGGARQHWALLAASMSAMFVALCVHGLATESISASSTLSTDTSPGAPGMAAAGPVLDAMGSTGRSLVVPDRTIALTFDDGPDPGWTPEVLDLLAREGVPATFFVTGSRVARYPALARRIVAEGHLLGNHTFTHADLLGLSPLAGRLELSMSQVALAGATGRRSVLFRPPFSSESSAVRVETLRAWQAAAGTGYVLVLADLDGKDWRPGAGAEDIRRLAMPERGRGGVVLLHDGGGDREATVAALALLIRDLRAEGYRFTTVGDLVGLTPEQAMPAVGPAERTWSGILPAAVALAAVLAGTFTWLAVVIAALAVARAAVVVLAARRHAAEVPPIDPRFTPAVTILVPAFNESAGIEAAVTSLAGSRYRGRFEVIVVDDGSADDTAARVDRLIARAGWRHVRLLRRPNGGKAAALNTGLRSARGAVTVTVDGDTVFGPDTLAALVQPFQDVRVGAVSGNTKVANRHSVLGLLQSLEYVQGFNLDRRLFDRWRCMPTVPGAIGAFRTGALRAVGGFSDDTLAEDTDLTMALHRAGFRVVYEGRAVAWTEAPGRLRDLWRQRFRWSYGTMQAAWKHRKALVEDGPGGRFGRLGLTYLAIFQILMPLIAPVVDVYTAYGLLFLNRWVLAAYWLGFTGLHVAVAAYALRLDGESPRQAIAVPLQQVVFRQLMYLVVIQAVFTALAGTRTRWQHLSKSGVAPRPVPPSGSWGSLAAPAPTPGRNPAHPDRAGALLTS